MTDPRDEMIARVVRGKSFCDVGGLWGTTQERCSVAYRAGASDVTMLDAAPRNHPLWVAARARWEALGIPDVMEISLDARLLVLGGPAWDVIHCSGVLYHLPDPVTLLAALRQCAREHVILASAITAGPLRFLPASDHEAWRAQQEEWTALLGDTAPGLTAPVNAEHAWRADDCAPWWWLLPPEVVAQMCMAAGFAILDCAAYWEGHARAWLLEVPR